MTRKGTQKVAVKKDYPMRVLFVLSSLLLLSACNVPFVPLI